jgi:hypothetical protein
MGLIDEPDPLVTAQQHLLDDLAEKAGGYDVLHSLDNAPLPGEEFALDSVPADVRDQVRSVLDQCDRCADELLGPEYRIACRRLLARAAPGIPGTALATARPGLVAAAACWVIGRGNHLSGTKPGDLKVKDLTRFFGITGPTVSQCGYQVIRAAGLRVSGNYSVIRPVPPSLLVSERRQRIITLRDRYRGHRRLTPGSSGAFSPPATVPAPRNSPELYQLVYTNFTIGIDHRLGGFSTVSARDRETTGNNRHDSGKPGSRKGQPARRRGAQAVA